MNADCHFKETIPPKRTMKQGMSSYLLKVTLRGTPQLIWRRFVVPSFTSLNRLHGIIQDVMGWENRHAHAFRFRKKIYVPGTAMESGKKKAESGSDTLPDEMFALDDLICQAGAKIQYFYDTDKANWVHDVNVESIRYLNPDWPFPIYCLEGVRACPPESCGGIDGFCELLDALKKEDLGDMEKKQFDPDRFSLEKINKLFKVDGPLPSCVSVTKKTAKASQDDSLFRLGQTLKKRAES